MYQAMLLCILTYIYIIYDIVLLSGPVTLSLARQSLCYNRVGCVHAVKLPRVGTFTRTPLCSSLYLSVSVQEFAGSLPPAPRGGKGWGKE